MGVQWPSIYLKNSNNMGNQTKHYTAPTAELIEVQVEKGFATSFEDGNGVDSWNY